MDNVTHGLVLWDPEWYRGKLQQLQERTATMAGMVMVFCEQLHWREIAILYAHLAERRFFVLGEKANNSCFRSEQDTLFMLEILGLTFGVKSELLPLMRVPGVKAHRARALFEGGITSLEEVRSKFLILWIIP